MDAKTNGVTEFKVGDRVYRAHYDNGDGAKKGQVATVKLPEQGGMIYVEYDGCLHDYKGFEGWCTAFAALSQEPQ